MEAIIATVVFAVLSVVCFSVSMLMRREKYAPIFAKANPVMPDGRLRYDSKKRLRSGSILLLIYGIVFLITAAAVLLTKVWMVLPNACLVVVLYFHGAFLILGMIARMVYLDTNAQLHVETEAESD